MIVLFQQRRDPVFLVFGIKRLGRNLIQLDVIAVERPEEGANENFVVEPGAKPGVVSARHEFTGHFTMRRRQRLKQMKQARVANRPGHEHEDECE